MRSVRLTAVFLVAMLLLALPNVTFAGKNDLVNMNVVNGDVRDVLMSLGKIGHASVIIDDKVQGKITVNLKYVPFDDALEIIAQVKGLRYDRVGNVIVVFNRENDKDKSGYKPDLGTVHILKLKHVKAEDIIDKVAMQIGDQIDKNDKERVEAVNSNVETSNKQSGETQQQNQAGKMSTSKMQRDKALPSYTRVKIDPISNSLVLKCNEKEFSKVQQLVEQLDIKYPEVLLEAKIVSIDKAGQDKLGIDWSWWDKSPAAGQYTVDGGLTKSITFGRSDNKHSINTKIALNALFQTDHAKILAKPQIIAMNGRPAFIHVGNSYPNIEVTRNNNDTIYTVKDYSDDGIILTYIPVINSDGTITASIKTEVSVASKLDASNSVLQYVLQFNRKRAETEIVMQDGETIVIGGLINKQELKTVYKVPVLGDLPVLGGFFKNMTSQSDDAEVVIFLTARVVKNIPSSPNKATETATSKKSTELLGGDIID